MVSQAEFQAAGFPVGGEPLGVDLADTLVTVTQPAGDLLADPERCAAWWSLQSDRLPAGAPAPTLEATRQLRAAARAVLDAAQQGQNLPEPAVATLNQIAAAAAASPELHLRGGAPELRLRWHADDPAAPALAQAAASVISLLASPDAARLRRCANPACSMLFIATDARRQFCTQNICANRVRAARHYHRQHQRKPAPVSYRSRAQD